MRGRRAPKWKFLPTARTPRRAIPNNRGASPRCPTSGAAAPLDQNRRTAAASRPHRADEHTHFSSAKGAAIQQPSPTGLGHLTPRDGGLKVRDSLKSMGNPRSIRESRTFSPHSSGTYYPALRTICANLIHLYSRENVPEDVPEDVPENVPEAHRILAGGASHRFPTNPGSPRQGRSILTAARSRNSRYSS